MGTPTEKAIEVLKKHNACVGSIAFVQTKPSPLAAWNSCHNGSWYGWILASLNYPRCRLFVLVCKEMIKILDSQLSDSSIPTAKDKKIAKTRMSIYLKQAEDSGQLPIIPENMGQCWFLPFHQDLVDVVKSTNARAYYYEHYLFRTLNLFRTACGLTTDVCEMIRSVVPATEVFELAGVPCE